MYSFGEIVTKVALLAQRSGDSDYATKIKDWVNLSQEVVIESYDFWSALQSSYRFTSVSGTETYFMPSDFDKPYRIFDRTNNRRITWITREEYYGSNISNVVAAQTGIPAWAMLYGVGAVSYPVSAGITVKAKSSDALDNTGTIVRVEGWLDSAKTILGYENITISTSSPTTYVAGTITFYGITRLTKSDDTDGYIILADSSSNVLGNIAPNDRQSRYPILYFGLIPGGSYTYDILYKRKVNKMVDDNDYPFMDCSNFLILNSYGWALTQEKESEARADQAWRKANDVLLLLMRNEQDKMGPDFQHKVVPLTAQSHRQ